MKSMMLAAGAEIRVLGWMTDGSPIYPIWGCDPGEGEGGEGGTGSEGGSGEGGTGAEGGATGDPAAAQTDSAALVAQIDMLQRRLQAADSAKGVVEKRLREIDDAGKSELEKLQNNNRELTEKLTKAQQDAVRARMEREILKHPGFTWHDPDTVLQLVDMSGIEIDDETDKVRGVGDALKKLAASKPFLLKGKQDSKDSGGGKPLGPTGTAPQGGSTDDAGKKREALAKKYRL